MMQTLNDLRGPLFQIKFLRAMAPTMISEDAELFTEICTRINSGTATVGDLRRLDALYRKFEKGNLG